MLNYPQVKTIVNNFYSFAHEYGLTGLDVVSFWETLEKAERVEKKLRARHISKRRQGVLI